MISSRGFSWTLNVRLLAARRSCHSLFATKLVVIAMSVGLSRLIAQRITVSGVSWQEKK